MREEPNYLSFFPLPELFPLLFNIVNYAVKVIIAVKIN